MEDLNFAPLRLVEHVYISNIQQCALTNNLYLKIGESTGLRVARSGMEEVSSEMVVEMSAMLVLKSE